MNKLIDFVLCGGVCFLELMAVIIGALLVQGIVYQLSKKKINLYKMTWCGLCKLDKKLENYFN